MKGATFKEVLQERIEILEREYEQLSKAYYKRHKAFLLWIFLITLLYSVIIIIIINN